MARPKGVSAVLVLLCFGLLAYGCGDDGATQDQLDAARAEGIKQAEAEGKLKQLQNQVKRLQEQSGQGGGQNGGSQNQSGGSGGSVPETGPVSTCTDGVRVGPDTSCSFAMNVAGEKGSNPDSSTISAYSPVTGENYTMTCGPWSGGGTVCTGGNGSSVYLP